MIYLLTNVARTQDVPLDGSIFCGNAGQNDGHLYEYKYSYRVILSLYKPTEIKFYNTV